MQKKVQLPIEVVPNSAPPVFRWRQRASTPIGNTVIEREECLPPHLENAVADLIGVAQRLGALVEEQADQFARQERDLEELRREVEALRGQLKGKAGKAGRGVATPS